MKYSKFWVNSIHCSFFISFNPPIPYAMNEGALMIMNEGAISMWERKLNDLNEKSSFNLVNLIFDDHFLRLSQRDTQSQNSMFIVMFTT